MVGRGLVIGLVIVALGLVPFVASACGENTAVAEPSFSHAAHPTLLDVGDFSLIASHPARVLLHVDPAQRLRVFIYAAGLIDSVSLRRVAATDGSMVTPQPVTLDGSPHGARTHVTYALLTHAPVDAGYYRLDIAGRGRIISLVVERHQ